MDLISACPLPVAPVVWQPRRGVFAYTVICKATYRLLPGVSPLAPIQDPVLAGDRLWGDHPAGSLHAASDLAPYKRRADVLLVGSAYAPGGRPVRSLVATLEMGEIHKSIEVCCDRGYTYDGRLVEGAPFARMPLCWERAAGGPETVNPVGVRPRRTPFDPAGVAIANLQPPGTPLGEGFEPVGFGPIAPHWPGRAWLLQGKLEAWSPARWFDGPLPSFVDPRFFNAAPPDQQVDTIPPDAHLVLVNLHPEHPRLVTNLQALRPRAVVERPGRTPAPIQLAPDTLWIDTDRRLCTLTFRGSTAVGGADEPGRVVVSLPEAAPAVGPSNAGLPFRRTSEGPPAAAPLATSAVAPAAPVYRGTETQAVEEAPGPLPALPFVKAAPATPSPAPRRSAWSEEPTATVEVDRLRAQRAALPFGATPPAPAAPPPAGLGRSTGTIPPPPEALASAPPAFWQRLVDQPVTEDDDTPEPETLRPSAPATSDGGEVRLGTLPPAAIQPPPLVFGPAPGPMLALGGPPTASSLGVPPAPALPGIVAPSAVPFAPAVVAVTPAVAPLPTLGAAPPPEAPVSPAPAAPAAVEAYAAAKIAFWRGRPGAEPADDEQLRAGEERLLEAVAGEAREGRAASARALRAALRRAARAAG